MVYPSKIEEIYARSITKVQFESSKKNGRRLAYQSTGQEAKKRLFFVDSDGHL
jgi:hypothetical protein